MTWMDWMDLARVYRAGASKSTELGNSALGEVMEAMAKQAERIGQARAQAGDTKPTWTEAQESRIDALEDRIGELETNEVFR